MITVTSLYRKKHPILSEVCKRINATLQDNPNITLAEFAAIIDKEVFEETSELLTEMIKKQMGERECYTIKRLECWKTLRMRRKW